MVTGDAFNRSEVTSKYVSPSDRFVVSIIVGVGREVKSAEEAATVVLSLIGSGALAVAVFDRDTGDAFEVSSEPPGDGS